MSSYRRFIEIIDCCPLPQPCSPSEGERARTTSQWWGSVCSWGIPQHTSSSKDFRSTLCLFHWNLPYNGCISADQRAKDQRATHKSDNFKSSNNFVTIIKKLFKMWQLWLEITYSEQNNCFKKMFCNVTHVFFMPTSCVARWSVSHWSAERTPIKTIVSGPNPGVLI